MNSRNMVLKDEIDRFYQSKSKWFVLSCLVFLDPCVVGAVLTASFRKSNRVHEQGAEMICSVMILNQIVSIFFLKNI